MFPFRLSPFLPWLCALLFADGKCALARSPLRRFSASLADVYHLGNTCDRFLSTGCKNVLPKQETIRHSGAISSIEGIGLARSWEITENNIAEVKSWLEESNRLCVSIIPDLMRELLFERKRRGNL